MFDALPNPSRNDLLDELRCFFSNHGHDLLGAAGLIAGAPGEARVISLALRLADAVALDEGIRRDLADVHALLALEDVREGDPIESFLLSVPGSATRKVEKICLLTDHLDDLLTRIDTVTGETAKRADALQTITTVTAA
jgi:hypothetical protein